MKKKLSIIVLLILSIMCFAGCDRESPVVTGIDSILELDCGTKLNLEEYLSENAKITDVTDEGTIEYKLSELEHTVSCNIKDVYNTETGEFNTEKFGEYEIELAVKDKSHNKTKIPFTVQLNPLQIKSNIEEVVEIDCGTKFNAIEFFSNNIQITNLAGDKDYKLDDFDYTIEADESIYTYQTGKVDTGKWGEHKFTLVINSASFENNKISFKLKLNPLVITKGYYVYESDTSSTGYDYLGYCEYKNTSVEPLKVNSLEFQFFDKDGVMIGSSDMSDYSKEYLSSGDSGYALDTFASSGSSINSKDEIVNVEIIVDFEKPIDPDDTSLQVGDMDIINSYDYNVSGFAGTAIITNPYDKKVEYYELLAGMYDEDDNLIGVMDTMGSDGINAKSKAKATAAWLPDSRSIPDKVKYLKASARVTSFEGK